MLPSVDSLLACRFMVDPPRGYSTAMPVSTLLWMLLPPLPTFFPAGASGAKKQAVLRLRLDGKMATTRWLRLERRFLMPLPRLPSAVSDWLPSACSMP
ncbi:hypothetical protein EYF80_024384 [Liparis tanakae]|uniref:Uncharacterized protein n=1 Tax=Liparis tanakae TaxID=230148 RepID=A0A4Z2HKG4_9TELE|nr:hypothetical protein EYF80_024384 [Liparis tanakae]